MKKKEQVLEQMKIDETKKKSHTWGLKGGVMVITLLSVVFFLCSHFFGSFFRHEIPELVNLPFNEEVTDVYQTVAERNFRSIYFNSTKVELCPENSKRNFHDDPIIIVKSKKHNTYDIKNCPVNCKFVNFSLASIADGSYYPKKTLRKLYGVEFKCGDILQVSYSKENTKCKRGSDICAHSYLGADIAVIDVDWERYDFNDGRFPIEKDEDKHLAVFVSRCNKAVKLNRVDLIKELEANGINVHSYGKCFNNKKVPDAVEQRYRGFRHNIKCHMIQKYYFTLSNENSKADYYVTEKLYQPLMYGSVPLYMGAEKVDMLTPGKQSIVKVENFESVENLAKYMLYLINNQSAYEEYFEWRKFEISPLLKGIMDSNLISHECKICIKVGDFVRIHYGNDLGDEKVLLPISEDMIFFKIRQQNEFYFKNIYLQKDFSLLDLHYEIRIKFGLQDIYKVYFLWDKNKMDIKQGDVTFMNSGDQLEIIFFDRNKRKRRVRPSFQVDINRENF